MSVDFDKKIRSKDAEPVRELFNNFSKNTLH